jgi:hypothetical protein
MFGDLCVMPHKKAECTAGLAIIVGEELALQNIILFMLNCYKFVAFKAFRTHCI